MKWLLCLTCLGLGLLTGALTNRWLRDDPALPGTSSAHSGPSVSPAATTTAPSASPQDAWDRLMNDARTGSLPTLETILRRRESGPLDYLGCIERNLSLWREIGQGTDVRRIIGVLMPAAAPASPVRKGGDWTPRNVDLSTFLFWQLGRRDPAGALAAQERGTMETLSPVFAAWAEKDPPAALKAADENYQGLDRAYNIVTVLSVLARSDPAEAVRLATGLKREGEDPVTGILDDLARSKPHLAFDFLLKPGNGLSPEQTSRLLKQTIDSRAAEPGGSPWEGLSQLADHGELATATAESLGVRAALPATLPPEALPILEKLPPEAQEKALVSGMAVALYRSDPVLADQVLARLPEGAAQRAVEAAMSGAIMGGSIENMPNAALGQRIASRLSYERQFALMDSESLYGAFTVSKGEAWISNVDDPYWHDQFAAKFADEFKGWDPAGAARVAASISDQTLRETALSAALTAWRAKAPGTAAAWEKSLRASAAE
ncbi:MAG: hypothetical protein V4726_22740 [Verrucomicrobiota bacterium]